MLSLVPRTALAAVVVTASVAAFAPAQAISFTDRAAWEAAAGGFADVDLAGQVNELATLASGSPLNLPVGGMTMTFDFDLVGLQVPGSWATWSGGNTPRVLYSNGQDVVTATFSGIVTEFGLEMQPDFMGLFDMTLTLSDATVITQTVDGNSGAMFFGWTAQNITGFTMTCDGCEFAFARMVMGTPDVAEVPEPATLALFGLGLAGLAFSRRRKIA